MSQNSKEEVMMEIITASLNGEEKLASELPQLRDKALSSGLSDFQLNLPTKELNLHAIKDIQNQEIFWNDVMDSKMQEKIAYCVFGGIGLLTLISGIINNQIRTGIGATLMMGALPAALVRLITRIAPAHNQKYIAQMRYFYNLDEETELNLLQQLATAENDEAKKMILINNYIHGLSDGSYKVKFTDDSYQNLEIVPVNKENNKGMQI